MYNTSHQTAMGMEQHRPRGAQPQKTRHYVFRLKAKSLLFLLVAGYILFSFIRVGVMNRSTQATLENMMATKEALQREVGGLEEQVRLLRTDAYVEKAAREELGLIKSDEKVVIRALPGQGIPQLQIPAGDEFRD